MRAIVFLSVEFLFYVVIKAAEIRFFFKMAAARVKSYGKKKRHTKEDETFEKSMEWLDRQPQEVVKIKSHEGLKLIGHYIPADQPQRLILAFHGWRGNWKKSFALCSKVFLEKGCSLLLVEQRAQGNSEGRYMGFGILERYDCRRWASYAQKRFGTELPVYLYGVSMGASTVLMAGGLKLPENVKGIIADCGFTTPYDMVVEYAKRYLKKGEFPDVPRVNRLCVHKSGYDLKEYSTLDAMKVCKHPVFFIHGTGDDFVPYYMTLQNYHRCAAKKGLLLVEGAGHCKSYSTDSAGYMDEIAAFFGWGK